MKFSANSLKKLIKGACYFEAEGGYLTAFRFSKKQIEMTKRDGYNEAWRNRVLFSGGIRLELKTNARSISFDYKAYFGDCEVGGRSKTLDAWVNGVLYSVTNIDKLFGKLSIALPEGEKLVKIYLPNYCMFSIKSFTVDGNYKSVKDKGQRVLVIGDSITNGFGSLFSSGSYFNELQRLTGYNMLNQGIGGYRCEPEELVPVDGFVPDKIITFLGTNWYNCPDQYDYEKATVDYYKKLTEMYKGKQIIAISPIWRDDGVERERFDWCRSIVKRECEKYESITFVDGYTLVPNIEQCFCDKIHPSEYGCLLLAQNLYKIIKTAKF